MEKYTEQEIRRAWHKATERIKIEAAARAPMIPSTISIVMDELRNPTWDDGDTVTVKELRETWDRFGFDPVTGLSRFLRDIANHRRD